jgi:hypothetical protein
MLGAPTALVRAIGNEIAVIDHCVSEAGLRVFH